MNFNDDDGSLHLNFIWKEDCNAILRDALLCTGGKCKVLTYDIARTGHINLKLVLNSLPPNIIKNIEKVIVYYLDYFTKVDDLVKVLPNLTQMYIHHGDARYNNLSGDPRVMYNTVSIHGLDDLVTFGRCFQNGQGRYFPTLSMPNFDLCTISDMHVVEMVQWALNGSQCKTLRFFGHFEEDAAIPMHIWKPFACAFAKTIIAGGSLFLHDLSEYTLCLVEYALQINVPQRVIFYYIGHSDQLVNLEKLLVSTNYGDGRVVECTFAHVNNVTVMRKDEYNAIMNIYQKLSQPSKLKPVRETRDNVYFEIHDP